MADTSYASGYRYLTGKVRSATTGTHYCTISGTSLTFEIETANVWQDFVTTAVLFGLTPILQVGVGWDGGANYSTADWSDVKLRSGDLLNGVDP